MSDRILGVSCIFLAALYVYFASLTELSFMSDPLGPKVFPYIIGTVLAASGAYAVIRPDGEPDWPPLGRFGDIVFAVAVLFAYTYALPELGFTLTTAVAAGLLSWRLGARPVAAAMGGVAIAFTIFVIFRLVLGLSLALGPWGF